MPVFAPPVRRKNHGRGHSYVDANGAKVPGVTTIIGDGIPKPALLNWAANTTAEYAVDHWDELGALRGTERLKLLQKARYADRDAAANKGTAVHALAEKLALGEEITVPEELRGHVESYVRFLDEWDVQPVLAEAVIVSHKHGYAGTLDLIADLAHPFRAGATQRWLLDVKTSRSGVFGETALQLAGYRYADRYVDDQGEEQPVPTVERTGVIHVRADGYSLVPVEAGHVQFRSLLYAQQIKAFCDEARDLVGEALEAPPHTTEEKIA